MVIQFPSKIKVVNAGLPKFAQDLLSAGVDVVNLDWKPPAGGVKEVLGLLEQLIPFGEQVRLANEQALNRILESDPVLIDMGLASEMIPGFPERTLLHAGPPLTWADMCGPVQGAAIGAILYEGWAESPEQARAMGESGEIRFAPCHSFNAVGPMAGILAPSMPVFVVENKPFGNRAYASLNEGLGKVLRFGSYDKEVLHRLAWLRDKFYPILRDAIRAKPGIIKNITSQALQMGDECHNRNKAATALFLRDLVSVLIETDYPREEIKAAIDFIQGNEHFYLNISMAACKATMDSARDIPWSTMVTAMARNGTNFGIQVSSLGEQWFTAPALPIQGLYFPGYDESDANPDLGDSAITETCGIGGFAMASSPAIVKFVGGTSDDAVEYTRQMYKITLGENTNFAIPVLNFRGAPTGIDMVKVLEMDIAPVINTGVAHKEAGIGQIGAGVVTPPTECFVQALQAFVAKHIAENNQK